MSNISLQHNNRKSQQKSVRKKTSHNRKNEQKKTATARYQTEEPVSGYRGRNGGEE